LKQQCLIELFYSSGLRLEELRLMKMCDIEASNNRIKVVNGKGKKERLPRRIFIQRGEPSCPKSAWKTCGNIFKIRKSNQRNFYLRVKPPECQCTQEAYSTALLRHTKKQAWAIKHIKCMRFATVLQLICWITARTFSPRCKFSSISFKNKN
ncbi:MAG: tyrosine-type recombinase/integrase, partial [Bacteroidetes bacterium]|nr:tyrosine-type recombinase/integrase [Bacteroidota bacterium]